MIFYAVFVTIQDFGDACADDLKVLEDQNLLIQFILKNMNYLFEINNFFFRVRSKNQSIHDMRKHVWNYGEPNPWILIQ